MKQQLTSTMGVTLWFVAGAAVAEIFLLTAMASGAPGSVASQFAVTLGVALLCGLIVDGLRYAGARLAAGRRDDLPSLKRVFRQELGLNTDRRPSNVQRMSRQLRS